MLRSILFSLLAFPALAAPSLAQVIEVPEDYADVQQAIDAASPGDTILVHGGTYGSITIDKPLTIIGPTLFEGSGSGSTWLAPITLSGSGTGTVVLAEITTGKEFVDGGSLYSSVSPGITGGGFEALHVYDSTVRAPSFCSFAGGPGCLLSGVGLGRPGIATTIAEVLVERSLVLGSRSDNDGGAGYPDGPAGIDAPSSVVMVFDSTVRGGAAGNYYAYPSGDCATLCFGSGGAAVVASELFHSSSTLTGGAGATWHGRTSEFEPYVACPCTGPNGAPAVTDLRNTQLVRMLTMTNTPTVGGTLTLVHRGGRNAILLASDHLGAPTRMPRQGLLFLRSPTTNLGTISPGPVSIPIPPVLALIGTEIAFQTLEARWGLMRPVAGVIR